MRNTLSYLLTFLLANFLTLTQVTAQGDFKIPKVLSQRDSVSDRPISITEIYNNYDALMQNPDTSLGHAKKVAQRWMAHRLPYLNVDNNGLLTNKPINDAFRAIYSSPLQCGADDLANWKSDGPAFMPDWEFARLMQQAGGWVDAVYNNALDTNIYVLGTRMSGFMRSTNGGATWTSPTDGLDFPVLGARQFLVDPNNPAYIMAITGTDIIEGSLIYSFDAGLNWTKNEQNLPQFYSMAYHPTIPNLIFAASRKDFYVSYDNGANFISLNTQIGYMDGLFQTEHWHFYQIMVLDDKVYGIAAHKHSQQFWMIKCDISNIDMQSETLATNWVYGVEADFIDSNKVLVGAQFSNIALGRYYLLIKQANSSNGNNSLRKVYKSFDNGDNYIYLPAISGSNVTNHSDPNIDGDINNGKCELIASAIDPNIVYNGVVRLVKRWNDTTGVYKDIIGAPDSLNGHHDDYRSSHLLTINGKDRISFW